ncbi:MAG: putative transport system ATP-binding protein [Clostridiales bacterium]|nr:putative transport system ATP-binding protein [Clostridiales bacterium]MDN5281070.1 putative transport system ATP-binding protein [Candidatus Ozemobacter sp.]
MNTVELKNTSRHYQSGSLVVKAVDQVDLHLKKGDFAVLAGPSGSGKSTLLNLIGGLDRPTDGEVYIDNELLNDKSDEQLSRERLEKIGFIFQAYNLIPVLTAYENVQFIMQIRGIPEKEHREKIMPLLKELGLEGLEDRKPPELSGGQQQRVAVARAIVLEPAIILADEPTANLDSETAVNLLQIMKQLNEEKNVTFLFSSHDPMVIEIAERVISMRDGKITRDERK